MGAGLRELFARPLVRAIFVATACGSAAVTFVQQIFHGLVTTPLAFPAKPNLAAFHLIETLGYQSGGSFSVAGRSLNWLEPVSAAIVLALVIGMCAWILRASR